MLGNVKILFYDKNAFWLVFSPKLIEPGGCDF